MGKSLLVLISRIPMAVLAVLKRLTLMAALSVWKIGPRELFCAGMRFEQHATG